MKTLENIVMIPLVIIWSLFLFALMLASMIPLIPFIVMGFPVIFYADAFRRIHVCELETKLKYTAYPYYAIHKFWCKHLFKLEQEDGWY